MVCSWYKVPLRKKAGERIMKTVDEFLKREKRRKGDAVCSLEKKKRGA